MVSPIRHIICSIVLPLPRRALKKKERTICIWAKKKPFSSWIQCFTRFSFQVTQEYFIRPEMYFAQKICVSGWVPIIKIIPYQEYCWAGIWRAKIKPTYPERPQPCRLAPSICGWWSLKERVGIESYALIHSVYSSRRSRLYSSYMYGQGGN